LQITILGGAGFVGLNIAARFLADGHAVTVLDRNDPPAAATAHFGTLAGGVRFVRGDVTDSGHVTEAIVPGTDLLVLGAAITAGAAREATDPASILNVNLMSQFTALTRAREAGVGRIVNLSSAAAYGRRGDVVPLLVEDEPTDPVTLYAITKYASEKTGTRLAALWNLDHVNVRLSGVFGRFEHATGLRDTLSPFHQLMRMADTGGVALLAREGKRDWIYATDVAEAVHAIATAGELPHRLYNISNPHPISVLQWAQRLQGRRPGFQCRLIEPGENANIDLHAPTDRAPLSTTRLAADLGWRARHDLNATVVDLDGWWRLHKDGA
jgi:UDP-glucose 4-epimerase